MKAIFYQNRKPVVGIEVALPGEAFLVAVDRAIAVEVSWQKMSPVGDRDLLCVEGSLWYERVDSVWRRIEIQALPFEAKSGIFVYEDSDGEVWNVSSVAVGDRWRAEMHSEACFLWGLHLFPSVEMANIAYTALIERWIEDGYEFDEDYGLLPLGEDDDSGDDNQLYNGWFVRASEYLDCVDFYDPRSNEKHSLAREMFDPLLESIGKTERIIDGIERDRAIPEGQLVFDLGGQNANY